jgi:hypothetical protein
MVRKKIISLAIVYMIVKQRSNYFTNIDIVVPILFHAISSMSGPKTNSNRRDAYLRGNQRDAWVRHFGGPACMGCSPTRAGNLPFAGPPKVLGACIAVGTLNSPVD